MKKYTRSEKIEIARQMIAEGRREEAEEFCKKSQIAANVFEKLCREVAERNGMCENKSMKKSEMTVSMPLTTWEEYEEYKKRYIALTERLAACFDDTLFKSGGSQSVEFDSAKSLEICREYLPYSMQKADIEIRV